MMAAATPETMVMTSKLVTLKMFLTVCQGLPDCQKVFLASL
jgi:hypothetical protein